MYNVPTQTQQGDQLPDIADVTFMIDTFYKESYGDKEKPDVIIVRARKV